MWTILFAFAISGLNPHCENALVAEPFNLSIGKQAVTLRKPLINRMAGARLILFTRNSLTDSGPTASLSAFQDSHPIGTIEAIAKTTNSESVCLIHTGYSYYKGARGIVLTLEQSGTGADLFTGLEIESKASMNNVKAVWIDRGGLDVRDLAPSL